MGDDDGDHHAARVEHREPAQHGEREDDKRDGRRQKSQHQEGLLAEEIVAVVGVSGGETDECREHCDNGGDQHARLRRLPDIGIAEGRGVPVGGEASERNGGEAVGIEREDEAREDRVAEVRVARADIFDGRFFGRLS